MIVYEFWLKEQIKTEAFDALCNSFYNLGKMMNTWDDPRDENGAPVEGMCVYSVSRNLDTHWVQLLVDDNAPPATITVIEAKINELKDNEPYRKYDDVLNNNAPIETPKHFTLEKTLKIRRKQKDGTLGPIE